MTWIGDQALAHLRDVADWPDVGDRYEITGRLGQGGMGVVYDAYDRVLGRAVAVKVVATVDPGGAEIRRLLAESRVLGGLEHPGIVPVHDAGTLPDGRAFYVMKRVRGTTLEDALRSRSPGDRLELFLRICDTVSFAHAQGIVHRDLKPQNVMVGAFGEVLVMDWGVASRVTDPADDAVVGTPGFMAPEQRGSGPVDGRADVYALGVLFAAMLDSPMPRPLAAVVRRASAERIDERYATVAALAADVSRYRDGLPVEAYREPVHERLLRVYRRHKLPILLVMVYVIVRVALLLGFRT